LPYKTRCKTGRTSAKVRETKSSRTFRNERTRYTPLDNILTFCCVRTIWVHSGPFCCLMKLGAKRAELVQKFVKRSRIGIFRNECTQSTPLDPKLTFWCVSYYLGAFGTAWLPYETRCKTGRTRAKVRATKSRRTFRKERTRSTPLDNILTFWFVRTIWVHSGLFSCLTKLVAKRAEQVQKFVPRSRVEIFRNKSTRSTGLYPKLMFWCVLPYLGAFGTVWLPYETRCKTGQTSAKVCASKSRRNFSQLTHPIHPIGQHTDVLVCSYYLGAFGTV